MCDAMRALRFSRSLMSQVPLNATPPGVCARASAPKDESSRRSSSSSPRGQLAKNDSERLDDNQDHRGEKHERRRLVEPAIPDVRPAVAIRSEVAQEAPAPK